MGKRGQTTVGHYTLATFWSAVLGLPLLFYMSPLLFDFSPTILLLLVLTGFCQMVYLTGLTLAYQRGDLSILYPLIRSSPLIILLIGGVFLGTIERVSAFAVSGVLCIVLGCFFLPMHHFKDFRLKHYVNSATVFALLAATATAGYSIIDDGATRLIRELPEHRYHAGVIALTYVVLQAWSASIWLGLALIVKSNWRLTGLTQWRVHSEALKTGLLIMATYALVVWAMAYARDVSYVAAFRQISILFGVAMAIMWLKEALTVPKLLGSSIVFIGLVLVVLG